MKRVGRTVAGLIKAGGKSEQDRARWWLTATRGNPRESATENKQPMISTCRNTGKGEMVRQERTAVSATVPAG